MREISLTRGLVAIVDDDDYDFLITMSWHAQKGVNTSYAATNVKKKNGRYVTVGMHRFVNATPVGLRTDHIDGNGLNNTKLNLRTATGAQNAQNKAPNRVGTSKHKGVYWDKQHRMWRVSIRVNRKLRHIGLFRDEEEAAAAYAARAAIEFGEFHRTERPAQ